MTSIDWMPNGGAPLLPKASPYCVPVKMMELKRRPTIYDLRGASWQLRHKRARPGDEVPWDRVFNWPPKSMHVITPQELYTPDKRKKKRAAKKGPKVVKAPPTPAERKFAAKFAVRFDLQRVVRYLKASADKRAVKAASADSAKTPTTAPTKRSIFSRPLVPGAFPGDGDDAAADIDAQTQSAANDEAQPSLLAAVFKFAFGLFFGSGKSKRALEDDDEAGDAKRRRVGSDAQAPARAEARPVAGKAARTNTTGATALSLHNSTTTAAKRRVRIAPPASLKLCPPPSGSASVAGNAKVVEALLMQPPFARPIAGRPTRKRADTPDPGAGTPPPSTSRVTAEPEASSRSSTPTSSPSSSRESSLEREPAPAPKESSSKAKSKSSRSKSSKSKSKSSSSESHSSSSESESESGPQASSSKLKAKSKSKSSSNSTSKSSSSKSKTKSSSSGSSSSSSDSTSSSDSDSESRSSKSRHSRKYQPFSDDPNIQTDFLLRTGTNIMLYPHTVRWTRDGEQVNPWDPHCPAPPDPRFPWAPAGSKWAQARPAPIALSSSAAATTISFQHPSSFCDSARAPPAATASAPRGRAASSAFDDLSGDETEVDSGAETDEEED